MWVHLHFLAGTENGAPPTLVAPEDIDQAVAQVTGDLLERSCLPGAGRKFHTEGGTEEPLELAQAVEDQIVDGQPNRPAPVRIAAKEITIRFSRNIFDF